MNRRQLALMIGAAAALPAAAAAADEPPATWDGLVRVPSKKLKYVFLAPGADFRGYAKVMIDPTEVAFDKRWLQNYNDNASFNARLTGAQIASAVTEGVKRASEEFSKAFADGGYPVVTAAGPDVLRVRTGVLNIQVAAPNPITSSARVISTSEASGAATFVIEARDSQSGALLGRAVDARLAGDNGILMRTSVSNWMDFRELVKTWAKISVAGLNELKALSPVSASQAAG
jgi:Protein of unknown function (DUF3313)